MSDIKWIKITTDIFDDEKILLIEALPESDAIIVIWFKLLCLAGKQNNSGVFMMNDKIPYTEKMLSTIFRRKESTVKLALKTFEEFGMIEIVDGVITIPNWGKHQNIEQLEARREYQREYHRKYREEQKLLADKTKSKSLRKSLRKDDVNALDKEKEKNKEKDKEKEEPLKEPNGSFSRSDSKIASGTPEEPEAAVEAIPLTNGSEWRPTVSEYDEYARLYPSVDITAAFRAMRGWSLANPTKRKTAAGVRRFVNTWLAKEQDRGSREPPKRRQTADDAIAMIWGA